jgi:hypothetical protein
MEYDNGTISCEPHGFEPERLEMVRRWIDELEGRNREKAFKLLELVMAGKITSEEALMTLDNKHDSASK